MNYVIKPLEGVNNVKLDMERSYVRKILGIPQNSDKRVDHYNESILQVHYNREDCVVLIEVYEDPDIVATIEGKNVFKTNKDDLRCLLEQSYRGDLDTDDLEYPQCHTYKNIGVGFWSDTHPDDFSEDEINNYKNDYEASFFFKAIGIGSSNYYA